MGIREELPKQQEFLARAKNSKELSLLSSRYTRRLEAKLRKLKGTQLAEFPTSLNQTEKGPQGPFSHCSYQSCPAIRSNFRSVLSKRPQAEFSIDKVGAAIPHDVSGGFLRKLERTQLAEFSAASNRRQNCQSVTLDKNRVKSCSKLDITPID
jgi:hypothetical protein